MMVGKVGPFLDADEKIEVKTGLGFWFTPPESKKIAPSYKQFLITLPAIFPLSMLVPWLFAPVFSTLPFLVEAFMTSLTIVALTTFGILPLCVRLVAKWLYL